MKLIRLINRSGITLYEHECENNTIKLTLEKAVREGVQLREVYLRAADLEGVNLEGGFLWNANIRYAKLKGANLKDTRFNSVLADGADLRDVQTEGSDLIGYTMQINWLTQRGVTFTHHAGHHEHLALVQESIKQNKLDCESDKENHDENNSRRQNKRRFLNGIWLRKCIGLS